MYTLPQHQEVAIKFFYNINTNVKISTKKKELSPKMKMVRTHSVYIDSQTHRFDKTFFIYSKNILDR